MKKKYERPVVEIVKFCYRDQVVAASTKCTGFFTEISSDPKGDCHDKGSLYTN